MGRGKPAPTLLHFIFKDHQPTGRSENIPPSRQRRLNSIVADATGQNHAHRGLKPIGIYTISGFPESHHRQVVDRSIPTYKTLKNPLESHHRQVVDRSIPTFVFRCRARRLDLNDPPPAGGGILGNLPSPCRLGLNNPPAPAGGIRLNIICVDTNGFQPTGWSENIPTSRERRMNSPQRLATERDSTVARATRKKIHAHRGLKPTAKFSRRSAAEKRLHKSQNLMRSSIFDLKSPILDPRSSIFLRVFPVLTVFVFSILTFSTHAFAQFRTTGRQASETQGSQANQLPLSGRSGQAGSVTVTQTPTPGTTTSVNTINPAIQTQGPFSGSVWGAARAPF